MARLLLARGADVAAQSAVGNTALHRAAYCNDSAGALQVLCAAPGAAVSLALRDSDGHTPLELAMLFSHGAHEAVLREAMRAHGVVSAS